MKWCGESQRVRRKTNGDSVMVSERELLNCEFNYFFSWSLV